MELFQYYCLKGLQGRDRILNMFKKIRSKDVAQIGRSTFVMRT